MRSPARSAPAGSTPERAPDKPAGPRRPIRYADSLRRLSLDPALLELPAPAALDRLLSHDGRLPRVHALEGLAPLDRALVRALEERTALRLTRAAPGEATGWLCLALNEQGRLHVRPVAAGLPTYADRIRLLPRLFLRVPPPVLAAARRRARRIQALEGALRREAGAELARIERGGDLPDLLARVADSVRHVEAVGFYVDDEYFACHEGLTTLVDTRRGPGRLGELAGRPVATWSAAERLCVLGLRALFLSGRSIRLEEFCGKVLSARALHRLLRRLLRRYRDQGRRGDRSPPPRSLLELGRRVGEAGQDCLDWPGLRYRWISGISYLKTERIVRRPPPRPLPPWVARRYRAATGRALSPGCEPESVFAALADEAIAGTLRGVPAAPGAAPAGSPLEELLQAIVASALRETDADYAMSSSLRDLRPLLHGRREQRVAALLALRPRDFFCCLVAGAGLRDRLGAARAEALQRAVQERMQFNRWHFIAGNLPGSDIPPGRHFFYPPLVPDLAEWCDQRHGGHVRAGVRYSIRAPGPDAGQPPLQLAGIAYRGFYDVRLVRMRGRPLDLDAMLAARRHCVWLGAVWRRLAVACREPSRAARLVLRGFAPGSAYPQEGER